MILVYETMTELRLISARETPCLTDRGSFLETGVRVPPSGRHRQGSVTPTTHMTRHLVLEDL